MTCVRKAFIFTGLFLFSCFAFSQSTVDCENDELQFYSLCQKLDQIDTLDPDLIPLHALFINELEENIIHYKRRNFKELFECPDIDTGKMLTHYELALIRINELKIILKKKNEHIETIFFENALEEVKNKDFEEAMYLLNRAIQYAPLYTDALILKMELLFEQQEYLSCLDFLHIIYNEAPLTRKQEEKMIDFTSLFYDRLYTTGDSLVKIDKAAESLEIFKILETFCLNMPVSYCNDDYYHGILRSQAGVYESYLAIAKVAREKGYLDIEQSFLHYADEYLEANEELQFQLNKKVRIIDPDTSDNVVLQNKTSVIDEIDHNIKSKNGKLKFQGYSGGMMFHTGYLFKGEINMYDEQKKIKIDGAPLGIGGLLRFHFGNHLRIGGEGYSSTLHYGKNRSYMTLGWGGLLIDCQWKLNKTVIFLGGTIGGGSVKNVIVVDNISNKLTEKNAIYRKYPVIVAAPFFGMEFVIAQRIRLITKADYIINLAKKQSDFATGPRFYVGIIFFHAKKNTE